MIPIAFSPKTFVRHKITVFFYELNLLFYFKKLSNNLFCGNKRCMKYFIYYKILKADKWFSRKQVYGLCSDIDALVKRSNIS